MKRVLLLFVFAGMLLAACGARAEGSGPVKAVEQYLNAIVTKNADQVSALSCADWESQALLELDSFQAVTTKLDGLSCEQTGTDGQAAQVSCKGKIIATYNGENQELDLSNGTFQVVQQGGDWLVCGQK